MHPRHEVEQGVRLDAGDVLVKLLAPRRHMLARSVTATHFDCFAQLDTNTESHKCCEVKLWVHSHDVQLWHLQAAISIPFVEAATCTGAMLFPTGVTFSSNIPS